jgi:hypothetical protein
LAGAVFCLNLTNITYETISNIETRVSARPATNNLFFIAFVLIATTKRLVLREYGVPLTGYGAALIGALLVGKVGFTG